jgi:hypothetical protein
VKCCIQRITYFGIFVEVYKAFDFSVVQFTFTNTFSFTSFKPVEVLVPQPLYLDKCLDILSWTVINVG